MNDPSCEPGRLPDSRNKHGRRFVSNRKQKFCGKYLRADQHHMIPRYDHPMIRAAGKKRRTGRFLLRRSRN